MGPYPYREQTSGLVTILTELPRLLEPSDLNSLASVVNNEKLKCPIFWHVTSCCSVEVHRRFGGTCCLHLEDLRYAKQQTELFPSPVSLRHSREVPRYYLGYTNRLLSNPFQFTTYPSFFLLMPSDLGADSFVE
jgi:hypothetical protein